jgi:signal peptide peptidase SppA
MASLENKPVFLSQRFNAAEHMIDVAEAQADKGQSARLTAAALFGGDFSADKPFAFNRTSGMASIPVTGVLLNRFNYSYSGATGYGVIGSQLQAALADPDVKCIAFDVNSPGGMVQGCFELADQIYAARGQKPMMAVVNANATSAAYAVASATGNIQATPSSDIGSIGVLMTHMDISGMAEQAGVKVTYVYAGKHKVDGNPFEPLSKAVKAEFQSSIDDSYEEFVALVARNRGIDAQVVRDTEAQIYGASDAKGLGLIDGVATPQEAITNFVSGLSSSSSNIGVNAMTTKVNEAGASEAAAAEAVKTAEANAAAAAKTAERTRLSAILALPEAKERQAQAQYFATSTDLTVEQVKGALAAAPIVAAAAAVVVKDNGFQAAMVKTENPNLQAGGDAVVVDDKSTAAVVARMQHNYSAATGNKITKS